MTEHAVDETSDGAGDARPRHVLLRIAIAAGVTIVVWTLAVVLFVYALPDSISENAAVGWIMFLAPLVIGGLVYQGRWWARVLVALLCWIIAFYFLFLVVLPIADKFEGDDKDSGSLGVF